jgi:hypothetical protein
MLAELAGFKLRRTLPDSVMMGVLTGTYKVFGGVVRSDSGQIVAHLVNAGTPINLLSAFSSPVSAVLSGINTFQLHRIRADVTQLLTLAKGTMLLSGLTLTASAAGFLFLSHKIGKIDDKLKLIAKDIKSIRKFLELQERARLIAALKVIKDLNQIEDESTRITMLINSRQTLGEIHEKYKTLLLEDTCAAELMPVEEYFTITAIGHAMCSAELNLFDQAANDMADAQQVWKRAVQAFVDKQIIKKDPERLLTRKYADHIKSEEIIEWLEFVENSGKGLARLDDLRAAAPMVSLVRSISQEEVLGLGVTRKLIERDKVLEGYVSQYGYYASIKKRPSEVQDYVDNLPTDGQVNDCYMLISKDLVTT